MTSHALPAIHVLTDAESKALLARNYVGRIAYAFHDRVDIEPIHYVYDPPWIFGRTSVGAKLLTLTHNAWCAFETDEVRGMFDWESVIVKGAFAPRAEPLDSWDYDRAVIALRRLLPATFTDDDPAPHRDIVFGVFVSEITGRCSISPGASRRR